MSASSLVFHACPPPGEWLNDPNGLLFDGQGYRLLAQHRADAPAFERTGWGGLESRDLLHWSWRGTAIAPDAGDAWSGSLFSDSEGLAAWHTRHRDGPQDQLMRRSGDGGRSWSAPLNAMGPARSEWRDPFIFRYKGEWRMLLAAPCPWNGGGVLCSRLELYRSSDGLGDWQRLDDIGPWSSPGVMWEVPLLIPDPAGDGRWSLIISLVHRRGDSAWCSVRRWRGDFDGRSFVRADMSDVEGEAVDCGPDFYAAMVNLEPGWPEGAARTMVAWASNWQTGRRFDWPGFHGGPIALPRRLTGRGSAPLPSIVAAFCDPVSSVPRAGMGKADMGSGAATVTCTGAGCSLTVEIEADGRLTIERKGVDWLEWQGSYPATSSADRSLTLFIDGPLLELHIAPDDRWVTCAVPIANTPFAIDVRSGAMALPISWRTLK